MRDILRRTAGAGLHFFRLISDNLRSTTNDTDYKINVMDERNIMIKEKAGNVTNMVNTTLLGLATVIFICLDYVIPAIVTGAIIAIQPIILITISNMLEKKM